MPGRRCCVPFLLFALVACQGEGAPGEAPAAAQKLVITGASTVAPLVSELGKRFEQRHPARGSTCRPAAPSAA